MKLAGQYAISEEDGHLFARLSGDFNPLHIDRLFARRLQFGDSVVHGVHHLLRTWDALADEYSALQGLSLLSLRASFPGPVKYGDVISYRLECEPDSCEFQILAEAQGRRCLVLDLKFIPSDGAPTGASPVPTIDAPVSREESVDQRYPPVSSDGECPLSCERTTAQRLFPTISRSLSHSILAQILGCTWIIGMKCPGLHSVFSSLDLSVKPPDRASDRPTLKFQVAQSDKRFARVGISVDGPEIEGMLDAFFRPPPVAQPRYSEITGEVSRGRFGGQRALVVGGSRGIGETTAKILAAGGAEVCITYFRGEAEARGVCADIVRGGGSCEVRHLDVLSASVDDIAEIIPGRPPSHVYFFSTPKIESRNDDAWNDESFLKYCRYYLGPVERLLRGLMAGETGAQLKLFYPSTVFIDQPRKGFSEYAVAKAAGEALCEQLTRRFPGLRVYTPRLPTMMTDQTASILPTKIRSVKDVMLAECERFEPPK